MYIEFKKDFFNQKLKKAEVVRKLPEVGDDNAGYIIESVRQITVFSTKPDTAIFNYDFYEIVERDLDDTESTDIYVVAVEQDKDWSEIVK